MAVDNPRLILHKTNAVLHMSPAKASHCLFFRQWVRIKSWRGVWQVSPELLTDLGTVFVD